MRSPSPSPCSVSRSVTCWAGAFLVEQVFNLPGLGQIALTAVRESDYPIVQAVALYTTLAFLIVSLAVDLLLLFLDVRAVTT